MATNRSRRLKKKLRVDEFQELGFDICWKFDESVTELQIDQYVERFVSEVIEARKLGFHGGGFRQWEGVIATQKLGKCTEEDRLAAETFWKELPVTELTVGQLYDIWWG